MKLIATFFEMYNETRSKRTAWVPFLGDSQIVPVLKKPFSQQQLIYALLVVILFLALLAGYYHAVFLAENKKYRRLEDRYVRVREEIGREAMQDLIDASYE